MDTLNLYPKGKQGKIYKGAVYSLTLYDNKYNISVNTLHWQKLKSHYQTHQFWLPPKCTTLDCVCLCVGGGGGGGGGSDKGNEREDYKWDTGGPCMESWLTKS